MAAGVSGYVEFDSSVSWGKVRVYYTEEYDVETNTSDLYITEIKVQSTHWYGISYYPDGTVLVNGVVVLTLDAGLGEYAVNPAKQGEWYSIKRSGTDVLASGVATGLEHDDEGYMSVDITLTKHDYSNFTFFTISGKYGNGWYVNASKAVKLTDIPRASSIGATDASIESISSVIVTRRLDACTHSIRYEFGTLSGYLRADGSISDTEVKLAATSIAFKLPTEFYTQIPNAKSGLCTLTCVTYSSDAIVGKAQVTTFEVTTNSDLCAPVVSGTVRDIRESTKDLTGSDSTLVRYFSQALCTIQTQARNGATVVSKRIGGVEVTEDTRLIDEVEVSSILFEAVDSRGYKSTTVVTCSMVEYIRLTANVQLKRTDPTSGNAVLVVQGDYFNDSFGAVVNNLSAKVRLAQRALNYGEYQDLPVAINGNKYTISASLSGLDYEQEYKAQVLVLDSITQVEKVASVGRGTPSFDWGEHDFRFNIPICIPTTMYGTTPPGSAKTGQMFFQLNDDGTYSLRIYNGSSWS